MDGDRTKTRKTDKINRCLELQETDFVVKNPTRSFLKWYLTEMMMDSELMFE